MPTDGFINNKKASDIVKRQLYKTKMCTFYLSGKCTRGSSCVFAHCFSELRPLPDLRNTRLCYALSDGRSCNDKNCPYAHNLMDLRVTDLELLKYRMALISKKLEMATAIKSTNGQSPKKNENLVLSDFLKELDDSSLALLFQWVRSLNDSELEALLGSGKMDSASSIRNVLLNQKSESTHESKKIDLYKSVETSKKSRSYTESRVGSSIFEKSSFQNVTAASLAKTEFKESISISNESNKKNENHIEKEDEMKLKLFHQWISNLPEANNNNNNRNNIIFSNGNSRLNYQQNLN